MRFDEIFEGDIVMGVPSAATEYDRKMPGSQDSNGAHCSE
jgi:hypothetical protein